jgi:hypothetical protein
MRYALLFLLLTSPLAAQGPRTTLARPGDPGYKSPDIALIWSILFTGGGHLYAGETANGLALMTLGLASFGAIWYECRYDDCTNTVVYSALAVGVLVKVYSIVDAPEAARQANIRHRPPIALRPTREGIALSVALPRLR